ncbi:MAG: DUF2029 domain-containing protein [Anaerolineae bacterium]|nr:DUF2029 domain-containing protein [Anaerolineae bacterium]
MTTSWFHQYRLLMIWLRQQPLAVLGLLSLPLYLLVLLHGHFRPQRMEPFFPIFFGLFMLYALGCWKVIRSAEKSSLRMIFGFALVFNLLLIPSWPTLSDDMFRYIWDGRVQAAGFSPYRYPSNAAELEPLRDEVIWPSMNRPNAVTIYPPAAQMVFAFTWRLFPDSVTGMKVVMIGATLLAGWLLVHLLQVLNQSPARALIFLWNPLLIFEVAHAAHVDALYLPLLVGAFLLRARAPSSRVSWRYEAGIGLLLGLATLMKLYPAMLAVPLWSLVDDHRRRHWRLMLPITLVLTVLVGYALYFQPGVNSLGFLSTYGGEFFNISPLMGLATDLARDYGLRWQIPGNVGMPLLVIIASLYMVARPARTARSAILRCFWPIGIYLLINHNLFAWYVLWLLPLIALELSPRLNMALAWWSFTGTVALSYTFFLRWREEAWGIHLQFWPLYLLLLLAALEWIRQRWMLPHLTLSSPSQLTGEHERSTLNP